MIGALVEEGKYPMELTLLQETSISLTELDNMDEERKWMYYYYIMATRGLELKELHSKPESVNKGGKSRAHMEFPSTFVSKIGDDKK